jgi:8-oxo-dGTP pyrophosphatase MutT (NUDIX family)
MIQSSGVIVIDRQGQIPTVLCVRAYANWDFPKGQLDEGETHIEAAIRELTEETTLDTKDIKLVGLSAPAVVYGSGSKKKTATYFLADRISLKQPFLPISPELGKPENDEYRWVPVDELDSLMPNRLSDVVQYLIAWIS